MTRKTLHYFVLSDYGDYGLCGPSIKLEKTAAQWKNVSCSKCLKKKPKVCSSRK